MPDLSPIGSSAGSQNSLSPKKIHKQFSLIFKPYGSKNAKNEYQVIKEYFLLKSAAPIGGQSCYAKVEVMKSAVVL